MATKLYSLAISPPSRAAHLMLEHKGIGHKLVNLLPGVHPFQLRLAGFPGWTVPALEIDGSRVQGSIAISRALDRIQPEPSLFPSDPDERRAVEQAEAWGERELQAVPRRILRWALANRPALRRWMAAEIAGVPAPGLAAAANAPVARAFARTSGADAERVRSDLAGLPAMLDKVDRLIAERTIGGEPPNAADYQIASTIRILLAFDDLRPAVEGRPAADLAMRLIPDFPGPVPSVLPSDWLPKASS